MKPGWIARLLRRWPVRLVLLGVLGVLVLRVAGGLLLDRFVVWESRRTYSDRYLLEGLVLSSPLLFGRSALPALERIIERQPWLIVEAYSAIARLSPERAARLLDERSSASNPRGWWSPPRPEEEFLRLLGLGLDPQKPETHPTMAPARWRWQLENSCLIVDAAGAPLVLFNDPYLGGSRDLWLYRPERPSAEAVFVGALPGNEFRHVDLQLECSLPESDIVELRWTGPDGVYRRHVVPPPPVLLWLPEIEGDSDEDGLTDRAEGRLLTDPMARDSDGDGVEDLVDPSPNGGRPPAPESPDAAIDEALRTLYLLSERPCRWMTVRWIVSEGNPERWAGGCGPTVNVSKAEVETRPDGMDLLYFEPYRDDWLGRFGSKSVAPGGLGDLLEAAARPGEVRLLMVNDHLGSDSEGYEVQLRRRDGRWQLVWFKNLWI